MSTRYFIKCVECGTEMSIAERSFRGRSLTPSAKRDLPGFVIAHSGHAVKIFSEYDDEEYPEDELTIEDYNSAQEESIKAQFGDRFWGKS